MNVLGLMSGTSSDGVDAALVRFSGNPNKPRWRLLNYISRQYSSALSKQIIDVGQGSKLNSQDLLELAEVITEFHADTAKSCDQNGIASIVGCHGQTLWHRPPSGSKRGASWQLLQAPLLATLLNRPVIYDFRSKDLALGGQGAPLVPLADDALLGRGMGWRGVLNLGGIANVSLIPPKSGPDRKSNILGWDCGPANSLIDLAVQRITNRESNFDKNGYIAAKGKPDLNVIASWLKEPFFQTSPPKSTGRDQFGLIDLEHRLDDLSHCSSNDLVSTLTIFSAAVIAQDFDQLYQKQSIKPIELFVAGGGVHNTTLFKAIMNQCRGIKVSSIQEQGIPAKAREAIAFALLAWWNRLKIPASCNATTGISRPAILGIETNPY